MNLELKKQKRRSKANLPHWPSNGAFAEKIVGTSHYQDVLSKAVNWPINGEHIVYGKADLIPQPDNAYDPNAVKIIYEGKQIGYLSKESAEKYKHLVVDNLSVYDPPHTTAYLRIKQIKLSDGQVVFSVSACLDFMIPPSDVNKAKSKNIDRQILPKLEPLVFHQGDYLFFMEPDADPYAINLCHPGDSIDVWSPEGKNTVYFYAKGSVGGSGKLAVSTVEFLEKSGFSNLDDLNPIIYSASGSVVLLCAKKPKK